MKAKRLSPGLVARVAWVSVAAVAPVAMGQSFVGFDGTDYTQNFNDLGESAPTAGQIPGLPGWWLEKNTRAATGNLNNGSMYNFGNMSDTGDRGIGHIGSNSVGSGAWGVILQNTTGNVINDASLAFDLERYRRGSGNSNDLLGVSTKVTGSISGDFISDFGASVGTGSGRTPNTGTDFNSLTIYNAVTEFPASTPANVAVEPTGTNKVAKSFGLTGLNWQPGEYLLVRFERNNAGGTDDGWGIDDFSLKLPAPNDGLVWNGQAGSEWSTSAASFEPQGGGAATGFNSGAAVAFTGNAAGSISIPNAVDPSSVTVSGGNYTFAGPGAINASGSVSVTGSTLTVSTSLAAAGGIVVNGGGTLELTSDEFLAPNSVISADGGTVSFLASANADNTRRIDALGGGATAFVASSVTAKLNGLSGAGSFTKAGDGTLVVPAYALTGTLSISAGTLEVNNGGTLTVNGQDGGFQGNLVVTKASRFNVLGTISGGGTVTIGDGSLPTLDVNAPANSGTPSIYNTINVASGVTRVNFSANSGQRLTLGAVNAGSADVGFGIVQGGSTAGTVVLTQSLSYTGATIIRSSTNGVVELQASNVFPSESPLQFQANTTATAAVGTLRLGGNSQTVRSIESVASAIGGTIRGDSGAVLTISGQEGDNTAFNGTIDGGLAVVKSGPSQQVFGGTLTSTGSMTANGGTLVLQTAWRPLEVDGGSSAQLRAEGGAVVQVASPISAGRVAVQVASVSSVNGGRVEVAATDRSVEAPRLVLTNTLEISAGGVVDLANNDMVIRQGSESEVYAHVASWWNGGLRDGTGLASSVAGTGSGDNELATLAVVQNDDNGSPLVGNIAGVGLNTSDIVVKYTVIGDANLNGKVDTNDMERLVAGIRGNLTGWKNGDNNYDGVVDGDDLANLLTVWRLQGSGFAEPSGSMGGGSGGAVPEPTALGLLLATVPMISRRRR